MFKIKILFIEVLFFRLELARHCDSIIIIFSFVVDEENPVAKIHEAVICASSIHLSETCDTVAAIKR